MHFEKSPTPTPFLKAGSNRLLQALDRCFCDLLLTSPKERYGIFPRKPFVPSSFRQNVVLGCFHLVDFPWRSMKFTLLQLKPSTDITKVLFSSSESLSLVGWGICLHIILSSLDQMDQVLSAFRPTSCPAPLIIPITTLHLTFRQHKSLLKLTASNWTLTEENGRIIPHVLETTLPPITFGFPQQFGSSSFQLACSDMLLVTFLPTHSCPILYLWKGLLLPPNRSHACSYALHLVFFFFRLFGG